MKKILSLLICVLMVMSMIISSSAISSTPVKSIKLDKSTITLTEGQMGSLEVVFTPSNTTQKLLNYSTSNVNVATVDATGRVTAVKAGKAEITVVSYSNIKLSATCNITVNAKADEPVVTISQLVFDRGNIPVSEGTLEDNWFTKAAAKMIMDKLNIKVKYVIVPNASREQKLATLLASGSAPDICMNYDNALIMNYTRNNGLVDFTPYMDKYASNIKQFQNAEWIKNAQIDGKQTRLIIASIFVSDATFVRKDWLDKVGLKAPTNPAEFYAMLRAFKAQDPGKLGDKMVPFAYTGVTNGPFSREFDTMLQGFLRTPPTGEKLVTPWQMWPETKDMLRYMNRMYNEGLMGEFILDTDQSKYKAKIISGQLGSTINFGHWMANPQYGSLGENLQKNVPGASYIATYPWKDPACSERIYSMILKSEDGFESFFVPKSCKYPLEAFKYLDLMSSKEYMMLADSGVEGVDYNLGSDGVPKPIDQAAFTSHIGWIAGAYQQLAQNSFVSDQQKVKTVFSAAFVGQTAIDDFMKNVITGPETCAKYAKPVITSLMPNTAKYTADLAVKWAAAESKIVLGLVADFEKNYNDGISAFRNEGGNVMAAEAITYYHKQYGNKK